MTINIRRGTEIKPPIILIYGTDKIGKSEFAAGTIYEDGAAVGVVEGHRPLFLSTGDEVDQIGVDRTDPLRSTEEVHEALVYAAEDKDHNVIVVDHLSDVEKLIHAEVAKAANAASVADIGYGRGYSSALVYWHALWADVERVRASGKPVILVCHAKVQKYEPPDGEGFDTYQPEIHTNSRGEGAGTFLRKKCDVIAFAQLETFTRTVGDGLHKTIKAATSGRRVLRLVGTPAYVAGNRYGLPPTIDLSWQAFLDAMGNATARKARAAE